MCSSDCPCSLMEELSLSFTDDVVLWKAMHIDRKLSGNGFTENQRYTLTPPTFVKQQ